MLSVWKKAALVPPLLIALWLLVDDSDDHDRAVWTALARHPPCLRVYRALLELTLLTFCTSLSLWVWQKAVGTRVVGILLFQPPQQSALPMSNVYQAVSALDNHDDDDNVLTEEDAYDAHYESDGEVDEPVDYIQPPLPSTVANGALDLLLLILISLFLFTISSAEGGKYIAGMEEGYFQAVTRIAAPMFPLVLFVYASLQTILPFAQRKVFWIVISYTVGAPMFHVTFRDGFIGDVLTSSVRPMQDLAFTIFYILSGLRGWWTQAYKLDDALLPLEKSWLLHTVVLPACMISPLWWRFLQNLRQSYDHKRRWPYLGNALKYFVAAQVSMMGLFDPFKRNNPLWIVGFVLATLYQLWWDVFMDWELLQVQHNGSLRLRASRLYPSRNMYWIIIVVNCLLRFCWTLSFLPQWYLDRSGMLLKTFDGNFTSAIGPVIASAEIVRRTLWGFLRLELEAIKTCHDDATLFKQLKSCSSAVEEADNSTSEIELKAMTVQDTSPIPQGESSSTTRVWKSDMSDLSNIQILGELCLWATAFTVFGFFAGAHRATL